MQDDLEYFHIRNKRMNSSNLQEAEVADVRCTGGVMIGSMTYREGDESGNG